MRVRKEISVATGNTKSVLWLSLPSSCRPFFAACSRRCVAPARRGVRSLGREPEENTAPQLSRT